jgi:hypothetical protein
MRLHRASAIAVLAIVITSASAKPPAPAASVASASARTATQSSQPKESELVEHGHYVNSSGNVVHAPAHSTTGAAPAGASAHCSDGTYSFSQHHRGTCSHHGGVASWTK